MRFLRHFTWALFLLISMQGILFSGTASDSKVLVVNTFDMGLNFNNLGGRQGGDQEAPGLLFPGIHYISSEMGGGPTGEYLKLVYDVRAAGSFSFYWMKVGQPLGTGLGESLPLNLSSYDYLGFWVRGEQGQERFKIEIHQDTDDDGQYTSGKDISSSVYIDHYLKSGIQKKWGKAYVPLKEFQVITDWSKILEIVITFENSANLQKVSSVDLDDIVFGRISDVSAEVKENLNLKRESLFLGESKIEDGTVLDRSKTFSLVLGDELRNIESVWLMTSSDGLLWKVVGKSFVNGEKIINIPWQSTFFNAEERFMLDVWVFNPLGEKKTLEKPFQGLKLQALNDDSFLDEIERRAFQYFWQEWSPRTGLFSDATTNDCASIAATGFGLSAYCAAVERGWVGKEEVQKRVLKTIDTFLNKAQKRSGFFYHFLKMEDASRFGNSEVSVVDTAILLWGMLTASEYLGGEIKTKVDQIYSEIIWSDFLVQEKDDLHFNQFRMGWNPEGGAEGTFLDAYWDYYSDEAILITLLAVASPTHPVSADVFYAWKRETANYASGRPFIQSWHGSLFAYQYAHAWLDFKGLKDKKGINWWLNTVDATVANRQFCIDEMEKFKGYGPQSWGVTSMAYPNVLEVEGVAHITEDYTMSYGTFPCGTNFALHDGTIAASGPAGSFPFLPEVILPTLKKMVSQVPQSWGEFGFRSSYNLDMNWFSTNYYGIDLGPTLMAIENYRTGFFWNLMKKNVYVKEVLQKCEFQEDSTIYESPKIEDKPTPKELSVDHSTHNIQNLIVEDFDDMEHVKKALGVNFSSWSKDPTDETQKASAQIDTTENSHSNGASLKIDYDVDSPRPAFNGFWLKLNNIKVSAYSTFEFLIKGSQKGFPNRFKIELKGDGKVGTTYVSGIGSEWKRISIPLYEFHGLSNCKKFTEFTIVFEDHTVGQKVGTVYIDDIQFSAGGVQK